MLPEPCSSPDGFAPRFSHPRQAPGHVAGSKLPSSLQISRERRECFLRPAREDLLSILTPAPCPRDSCLPPRPCLERGQLWRGQTVKLLSGNKDAQSQALCRNWCRLSPISSVFLPFKFHYDEFSKQFKKKKEERKQPMITFSC